MKRNIYIAVSVICVFTAVLVSAALCKAQKRLDMQEKIAGEIIRFHVRANSDDEADQKLKLKVRNAVISYLEPLLAGSDSIEKSRSIIAGNEFGITATARNVIVECGFDYDVKAYFERTHFPVRTYGEVTLPAGIYEAYRIDIGSAKGHNWWCVLYPPLCFEDATHASMTDESKEALKQVLTEEEYQMITNPQSDICGQDATDIKVRFRILKFLNKYVTQ